MSILKIFRRLYGRANPKQALAFIAALAMVASLIQPASMVHAADDTGDHRQIEKIESFTGKLVRGATLENGKYIWSAKTDADDHRFTFRVDFSLSGVKELAPGAIKIWIPKTILKDRDGKYADYMDLSYPSEDEYRGASEADKKDADYIWKESTDEAHKNCVEITNVKERTAGENGYFEVSYITNKQTFEYKDEATYKDGNYVINKTPQSDPFCADISVTNTSEGAPQTVTATTDKTPVYINTTAEIESTTKKYPNRLYKEWQSSWGTQPENTKGMYFLVWQVVSDIKSDPTQPYRFTLEDEPVSNELKLIGYSMSSESGPFTNRNYVEHQRSDNERYDYVLTWYDPNTETLKDKDQYELKNSVKATVTPEDEIDAPTNASSKKVWEWDTPKFTRPPGHFYGLKFGDGSWDHLYSYNQKYEIANTYWEPTYEPYHDYSDYDLDKFQNGEKKSIDTFAYGINVYGFPAPWTVKNGGDPFNPDDYQKKPVKYELTDEELYLNENIKAQDIGTGQLKFTFPENVRRLDDKDYQFLSAKWQMHSEWRTFNKDDQEFTVDDSGKYDDSDVVHFWVKSDKTGTDKYTEVASYNLGKNEAHIDNADVVADLSHDEIKYQDGANVTGIRFTTSNPYWFTNLSATPMVRLKNSDFVMNDARDGVKDRDMIRLYNFSHSDAYSLNSKNEWKHLYGLKNYGYDRAIRPKKESELTKHIASTGSDKIRKKYIIRWKIRQKETLTTNEGTDYLTQKSGKFYDLLPKGLHLQKGSVDVETEKGLLSHSSFSYSIEEDYKGSGRDMVAIEIPVGAKYYNLYFSSEISWTDIKDYGESINNPVAYETGNAGIWDGRPDDAYGMSDANKGYMMGLDPKCTANRFLYDEEPHDIDTITDAVSGLKKQVKDSHDASYSYETYTTTNGSYSYKIRFANTMTDKAKDLIFFDSLENYNLNQKHSDWHGILKRFDISQLKQMGIDPVIYVSKTANLSIDDHHDITDTSVWEKVTKDTDLSEIHAFAIDCRKTSDGKDFVLNEGESISAVVYMKAPGSVNEVKGQYAKAYNNIYIQDAIKNASDANFTTFFIHQDYTAIAYRVEADIRLHKQNANNANESVEGAKYKLSGTSDYGTEVDEEVTTGAQGNAVFEGIPKGTYTLKESYSPDNWLLDETKYTVKVDSTGKIACDEKEIGKTEKIVLKDSPRIHGDISFMKYSTAGSSRPAAGAKFRLSGKSKYGNEIMMYATSDTNGKVRFGNVEYGSYKIKEVEAPKGYISVSKEYDASVSDTGFGSIDDTEVLSDGTKVIRNEPYHTVEVSKQSSYDNAPLSGAEFKLTGTSDYGTAYDKTATSGENGLAKFTGLEPGTYIIQETKSPNDYFLDTTKHIVKVNKDDTYTIDGLEKNDSKKYRMNNRPERKEKIVIKKKWKDDVTNDKRPVPVIHITTNVNKLPSYAVWRDDTKNGESPFYYVNPDYKYYTSMKYADNITSADQVPENAVRLDRNYDNPNAKRKIWGWLDDGTMYYWTNAQTTRLTDKSKELFRYTSFSSIDLSKIDTSEMTDMSHMFENCSVASLDLSNFDTSNVTNMGAMFDGCRYLTSLDLSNWDTSKATDMSNMFCGCYNLTSLNLSNFDTSKVTDMKRMFWNCKKLTSLNLSKFNTSQVMDMSEMFEGCEGLTSLDVSNFDTSKVTEMYSMFDDCHKLTSLDLSSFDTQNVKYMNNMFTSCYVLASLDISNFNTSKVTNMSFMFEDCEKLTSLDVSKFNTTNVTNMERMFQDCGKLTSLDVSNWITTNVTNMSEMFEDCYNLTNIYVSDKWNTDKVTDSYNMFNKCSKLPNYNSSSTNKTHANYGADGYLTYKAAPTAKTNTSNTSFASRLVSMILSRLAVPVHAADSVSYASTDKDNCKITKEGDIWTYEFSVVDASAKYYAYEDDVKGYKSSNDVSSYGIVTKDEPLTITNTATDCKTASLSLSKKVDGKQLVYKPAEKYSHTSNIDDTGNANGAYDNNLNTNDVVTFPGASKLHVKLYCSTELYYYYTYHDWACVWAGNHPDYKADENYSSSKLGQSSGRIGGGWKSSMSDITPIEGDIDGDSVTFGFKSNEDENYYGYYAIVTGYYANGNYIKDKKEKVINDSSPVEDIPSFYSDMTYMFNITLKNSDSSKLSGTKIFGNTIFTDGKAQVGVKAGETKTFSSLPGGTTYTITEKKYDNFITISENATGTLNEGDTAEAKFANHYQKPKAPDTPKEYSSFTLKKNVTGFFQNTQNYTFDVSFRRLDPNTEYSLSDGTKFTSDADGYGYVQTRLSDKGSVTFTSLPVGAQYRVTEESGDWSSVYRITNSADKGDIAQSTGSAEKNESLSTEWETADSGEGITVTYTNTVKKYQRLALKKAVTGWKATNKFRFTAEFKDLHETVSSDAGTIVPDDDGTASVDVYLNAEDEIVFKNVPVTAKYRFTEKANAGTASYTIRTDAPDGVAGGKFVKSADGNTEAMKDLSTAEETVDEGENATVTFLNNMPKTTSVTLKKQVSGAFADRNKFFRFTVSLTGADKNQNYSFDYTKGSSSHDGKENAASITTDENGHGSADIWLKHNDTVVIKDIPLSAKYSVAEDPGEYVPSITINDKKAASVSERQAAPDTIVFTNTNTAILPTGLRSRTTISMICVAIIFLISFFTLCSRITRKRKKH